MNDARFTMQETNLTDELLIDLNGEVSGDFSLLKQVPVQRFPNNKITYDQDFSRLSSDSFNSRERHPAAFEFLNSINQSPALRTISKPMQNFFFVPFFPQSLQHSISFSGTATKLTNGKVALLSNRALFEDLKLYIFKSNYFRRLQFGSLHRSMAVVLLTQASLPDSFHQE